MTRYLKKSTREFIMFTIVSMLGALSVVLMAYIINLLVETITGGTISSLYWVAVLSLIYILIDSYLDYAVDVVNERLIQKVMFHIREDLLESLESQAIYQYDDHKRELYLNVFTKDLDIIEQDYLKELLSMYNDIWVFVFGLVSSIVISPLFSIIMIALSSLPFLLPYFSKIILGNAKLELSQKNESYIHTLNEILESFSTLKIYGAFPLFNKRISVKSKAVADAKVKVTHTNKFVYAISYGLRMFVNTFSWVIGGYFVLQDSISLAVFFTVKQLTQYVAYPIQGFGASYTEVIAAKSVKDKVFSMIDLPNKPENKCSSSIEKITFTNFSVQFSTKQVFNSVDLKLERGKKYLLIGESGSGKSTFLKSIIGGVHTKAGEITFEMSDGTTVDVAEIEKLYSQISYMEQETEIFHLTLEENITLLNTVNKEEVELVLRKANLNKMIESNDRERLLEAASGGEKRRIDLARVFYFNRDIMIFDEPTAGLDSDNRKKIEEAIAKITGKLVIYSTHQYDEEFLNHFDEVLEVKNNTIIVKKEKI